ncbi:Glucoside xylosyltransferase 1 [Halocaridina rubra]|uniref:UDP-D-xylose:beta-D-glucoside alpha-1,3-D-xylosyltransferase n=1 Tax=Halocaridina rubra TaxID=373956 RepID=A0AAN9A309_HALRR
MSLHITRKSRAVAILVVLVIISYWYSNSKIQWIDTLQREHKMVKTYVIQDENYASNESSSWSTTLLHFSIIACVDSNKSRDAVSSTSWRRQMRQIEVLFKSAAVLTSNTIQFHIVSSSFSVYEQITNITTKWPEEYKRKIIFDSWKSVYHPSDIPSISAFKKCATARLFLPYVLQDLDSVIFVDTDMLFLRPPEALWQIFKNFTEEQITGMVPSYYLYKKSSFKRKFPTYGKTGLNGGLMLMNLTRMRNFPKDWLKSIKNSIDQYGKHFYLADQDILVNVFSKDNSKYLNEMSCEWNFRYRLCRQKRKCKSVDANGIGLLHGNGMSFTRGHSHPFKELFHAWEKYSLRAPVPKLLEQMVLIFKRIRKRGCGSLQNAEDIFLKGFKTSIDKNPSSDNKTGH